MTIRKEGNKKKTDLVFSFPEQHQITALHFPPRCLSNVLEEIILQSMKQINLLHRVVWLQYNIWQENVVEGTASY